MQPDPRLCRGAAGGLQLSSRAVGTLLCGSWASTTAQRTAATKVGARRGDDEHLWRSRGSQLRGAAERRSTGQDRERTSGWWFQNKSTLQACAVCLSFCCSLPVSQRNTRLLVCLCKVMRGYGTRFKAKLLSATFIAEEETRRVPVLRQTGVIYCLFFLL